MLDQGKLDRSALENMDYHAEAALRGLEDLPADVAQPLLEDLNEFTAVQQRTLAQYVDKAPPDLLAYLETSIEIGNLRTDRIREMADLLGLTQFAGLISALAGPASNEAPSGTLAPTMMPTRVLALAALAVPTATPTGTRPELRPELRPRADAGRLRPRRQRRCDSDANAAADATPTPLPTPRNADADGHADADCHAHANADADGHANADADSHANADCQRHANADVNADADANGHADPTQRRRRSTQL